MLTIYDKLVQGSDEWLAARCGILTASEVKEIVTSSTLKYKGDTKKSDGYISHVYDIAAQRITNYVEPQYITDDMMRGKVDEIKARLLYSEKYEPVTEIGFMIEDKWGFQIGYSPDGLVGNDGSIECKSRRQKYQIEVAVTGESDPDHYLQLQTGLLVSGRKWIDYISYCGGMKMIVLRVYPDKLVQEAIVQAAERFYQQVNEVMIRYDENTRKFYLTEREVEQEMII